MTWEGLAVLAVVPARGGSKGIPRKNLQKVGGMTLIARAAAVVRALPWLDRAMLSTDDEEIAEEGRRHGLDVPFMRPSELATDTATAVDTWRHAWIESERHYAMRFDAGVWLQPTSPFRTAGDVERTFRTLVAGRHRAATTVSRVPGHFTPEKLLVMDRTRRLAFHHPAGAKHSNRHTVPPYDWRNGLCYAATRETVVSRRQIVEEDCVGVEIEGAVVNIDDPEDLRIAQLLGSREGEG
jgi:CMP-N-acetylneuraminic acid synthetase